MAMIEIGILIRNSQCHVVTARMAEAMVGPAAAEIDTTMAISPMARPSFACGTLWRIRAALMLISAAPPRPCSTRAKVRNSILGDQAHRADAMPKITIPAR